MNQYTIPLLAIIGGIFLSAHGALNASLGVLLKNPLLASLVTFIASSFFAALLFLTCFNYVPGGAEIKRIPLYLWFTGGLFSVLGISLYYFTIPKLGLSTMISFGLLGQLTFSVIAGHFGWLGLPVEPIGIKRVVGVVMLMSGVLIINK